MPLGCTEMFFGKCWGNVLPESRSRDELIRDVLLWTPTHGRAKAGRPARMYIQQLCEDTGCCPEDLTRAMNDREEWRERVRDIRAASTRWWWWWWWWWWNFTISLMYYILFFERSEKVINYILRVLNNGMNIVLSSSLLGQI